MIRLADNKTESVVKHMWETCFDDSEAFVDLYFSEKYKNENTLIYFEDNRPVASLQMLPYQFTFCHVEVSVAYISGACTLPEFRNKGYMSRLLHKAFDVMRERDIPLSLLIPAKDWLYDYYAKQGYAKVFEKDETHISLKEIIEVGNNDVEAAYVLFRALYERCNFCVQKSLDDFKIIVKDAELENFPSKTNLSGMARVVDAQCLLTLFARRYPEKAFVVGVSDPLVEKNDSRFEVKNGKCKISRKSPDFSVNINELCSLLFGVRLEDFSEKLRRHFESHRPIMNFMLE